MSIRQWIPAAWRLRYQLMRRSWRDHRRGLSSRFAGKRAGEQTVLPHRISLRQAIMPSPTIEEKRHNFRLAIERISPIQIFTGEVFSFWRAVGAPTRANGFREGRTIIGGQLQPSVGGGLCQISGLLYAVSLRGGLDILERHNHSVDIYTEATRYTPLGSDATVAYGYKDLRIKNNTTGTLSFGFTLETDTISIHLNGEHPLREGAVEYRTHRLSSQKVEVFTLIDGQQVTTSRYEKCTTVPPLIQDHDPHWTAQFRAIKEVLLRGLEDLPVDIEHIGSTAVPGLAAKPIIDLDIVVPPSVSQQTITERLAALGYRYHGDQGIPDREVYKRRDKTHHPVLDQIRHHLYACPEGNAELHRHIKFRDALRASPEHRAAYAALKRKLANEANQNKRRYAKLKERGARHFVNMVLRNTEH